MMQRIEYYSDYRAYLKDYYADQKKRFSFFSNRYFCKKAGIKSPSLLKEVVEGKRNLTEKTIPAFIRGLKLNESDGKFFTLLVHFNQSREPHTKQQYLEQMRGLTRKVKQDLVPADHYAYYSKWYNPVIRELACLLDWKDDFGILARSVDPPIKKAEARESVKLLLELKFLVKSKDGSYSQSHPAITTGKEVTSLGVRTLNHHLSAMGMEAIDRFPPSERDVSSLTIGISKKSYSLIKQEIQEFKNRIIRIVDDDEDSAQVYNVNVQLFPLSKKADKEKGSDA
jgi:uncharacterized protein (TIGR02147 family)